MLFMECTYAIAFFPNMATSRYIWTATIRISRAKDNCKTVDIRSGKGCAIVIPIQIVLLNGRLPMIHTSKPTGVINRIFDLTRITTNTYNTIRESRCCFSILPLVTLAACVKLMSQEDTLPNSLTVLFLNQQALPKVFCFLNAC